VATLSGDSYEVLRNESLWKIASRLRPGAPQTINQTMIALYRANPSAFAGNINRLRAGAVLRIPQAEEFDAVDMRGATAEVTRQFNEWRPETAAIADEAHLRLVTPTEPAVPIESAATTKSKAAERAATEKVAADKAKTQEAERVAAATKQRESDAEAKRLLDLKNAELARMQADREKRAAAEAEAAKAAPAGKAAEATPPAEEVVPAPEEPAQPVTQTKPTSVEAKPPVVVEPSFMDKLNENRAYLLIGLALLLVIGGGIVYSRRRQPANRSLHFPIPSASEPTLTPADFDAAMVDAPVAGRGRAQTESYDFDSGSRGPESLPEAEGTKPLHTGAPPEFASSKPARSADDTMSSETAVHLDQQDAVAEADFHMAYGLYDQAADLVKIAIGREPKRRDLKLKLLEIYFVWGNKELFVESARDLHDSRSQSPAGEWDKILIMGKQIAPEDALFKGGSVASPGDNLDVNLEGGENRVDFDLFSTPEAGEGDQGGALDFEIGNTGARAKPSSHLDFLLDDSGSAALADDDTREMDTNARTQETPTIESPVLARMEESLREPTVDMHFGEQSTDQTAELSIDDLGLDVGSLESTGSLERTTALSGARREHLGDEIGDEEMTRIAPAALMPPKARPANLEPTMEVPQVTLETSQRVKGNDEDSEEGDVGVSTIYLEQMETGSGDVLDTLGPRGDETAHMLSPADLDLDLAQFGDTDASEDDTIRRKAARMLLPSEATAEMPALRKQRPNDTASTVEQPRPNRADMMVATSELPEIEPVTMSEVGTKLDLARAYMDMGDPDGARSILEEVLGEGNSGQRAEAQRLLDSIR
jgi:pilus assembly protein FimV